MIAYDKRGAVFALTEGAELLLHDGDSEAPLWRTMLDARVVGVGCDGDKVTAVTESGSVRTFGSRSGDVRGGESFGARVRRACVDTTLERIVAITDAAVIELRAGAATTLVEASAHAIALRPDGGVLVATQSELIEIAADGTRRARPLAGMTINALTYHPGGFWVLGLPAKLMRWDGSGEPTHITNLPPGSQVEHVACSDRVLAVSWDRHMVAALAWPSKDTLGSLQYLERNVEGLAVGPWPWLGVALDLGDGNKFNLESVALHRSDTHPGRQHHSWLVSVGGNSRDDAPRAAPRSRPAGAGNPLAILLAVAAIVLVVFLALR
jgi:hypothetical protein